MWSSRSRKAYQVIDDDYDSEDPRTSGSGSILPIVTSARSRLFGGQESRPLISTPSNDGYSLPSGGHVPPEGMEATSLQPPQMVSSGEGTGHRWDHIRNLDQFFSRVYEYHQGGGFMCISIRKLLSLVQFIFIVTFSTFFLQCVDYDVMFANKNTTSSGAPLIGKRHFNDVIVPNCASHLNWLVVLLLLFATVFWMSRVVKTFYYLLQLYEIQLFYNSALNISDDELRNLTWHAIVSRICEVQPRLQLMINSEKLAPEDVYNRILRFKNYLVTLVNQQILPPVFDVPLLGKVAYFPNGLKFNIKRCLFYGSTSPWNGPCLKEEYRMEENLDILTRQMEKHVAWYGLMNLVAIPFTFVYQILYSFFLLSEMIKKSPDTLGMRRYSNYGRYRVRHYNELNHELDSRLNRSHVFANAYMNQFYSPLLKVIASNVRFMVGAVGIVLGGLTMWDEDVIQIEHILTVIAACGGIFVLCNSLIPEENLVWQPEVLMAHVTSELHEVPEQWKGQAHTEGVRREFEELFQLKWMFLLHELMSPILTPFILLFWMRPRCGELVRFFHTHTVAVSGLGDVCSFALLDVGRHGDKRWNGDASTDTTADVNAANCMALDGKTELSVLHFASMNPGWIPPPASEQFIRRVKNRISEDASRAGDSTSSGGRNLLVESVHSLLPTGAITPGANPVIGEGLHRLDGPLNQATRPDLLNSLNGNLDSLSGSQGVSETVGQDLRVQTLFLRGMHEELKQSMAPSSYGGSVAPHAARSLFGVPQFNDMSIEESGMEGSGGRSRLVMRPPETVEERDEEEGGAGSDDERPPIEFGGG